MAVTQEQVARLNLPTRPTKRSDSRAKGFKGGSVELDAIPPDVLRGMVRACIESHIDRRALRATQRIEAQERETLARMVGLE